MPRGKRLALPEAPGVYRMLRSNGDVLYVGKATSLKQRVNSYFRQRRRVPDRTLEMLTQARDMAVTRTATPLEAALLELDEIKTLSPPYNVALVDTGRSSWFASADLGSLATQPDPRHCIGPIASPEVARAFTDLHTLLRTTPAAVGVEQIETIVGLSAESGPDPACFFEGLLAFRHEIGETVSAAQLLRLGSRLWKQWLVQREAQQEADHLDEAATEPDPEDSGDSEPELEWDKDRVVRHMRRVTRMAAHLLRRASWVCSLSEASLIWGERMIIIERGQITQRVDVDEGARAPAPPGWARTRLARQRDLDRTGYDRLRVLTTELRREVERPHGVELCFGPRRSLGSKRLRRVLAWV